MSKPPLCRFCGKAISKRTDARYISDVAPPPHVTGARDNLIGVFRSREDVQRAVNAQVVSVRYTDVGTLGRRVWCFSTWDGESYVDPFFCNGAHAQRFAYAAARSGYAMPAFNEARSAQELDR